MGSYPWLQELSIVREKGKNSWINPAKGWLSSHLPGEYNKKVKNILNFEQIVKLTQKGNSSDKQKI